MTSELDHRELYRLPWSLTDNGISWLEPTAHCNLACDACYRENRPAHKTFEEAVQELDVLGRHRRSDALAIAGGDPLLYPDIERIVSEARRRGYKPVINTNGLALTTERIGALKSAGLAGFTIHVDSKQGRPGKWKGKNELELCELRDELADRIAAFDLNCSFNATIYPDTAQYVAPLTKWAEERMGKVHVMVFIVYRDFFSSGFRFFAQDREVVHLDPNKKNGKTVPSPAEELTARSVVKMLQASFPDFAPSAYLNGTEDPSSFKWLLASRIGRPGKTYGYVGPRFQEWVQSVHHLLKGRYFAYAPPKVYRGGKTTLLFSTIDQGVRGALRGFLRDAVRAPLTAVREPLNFQSILLIQPIDLLADGRMNMCDGCPDITVYNGELVWSCRLDELRRHGRNLWARPGERSAPPVHEAPAV